MQFTRMFHVSRALCNRWTSNCDSNLLSAYEKFGPAWSLIARESGRKAAECRRRWLTLSGTLEAEKYETDRQLWIDGYERSVSEAGEGWIRVPVDELPQTPLNRLVNHLQPPLYQSNWKKKRAGWSEAEFLILREGYEQEILPLGPEADEATLQAAWLNISRRLSRRTAEQCRSFFERQHVLWRAQDKLNELMKEATEIEVPEIKESI